MTNDINLSKRSTTSFFVIPLWSDSSDVLVHSNASWASLDEWQMDLSIFYFWLRHVEDAFMTQWLIIPRADNTKFVRLFFPIKKTLKPRSIFKQKVCEIIEKSQSSIHVTHDALNHRSKFHGTCKLISPEWKDWTLKKHQTEIITAFAFNRTRLFFSRVRPKSKIKASRMSSIKCHISF